MTLRRFDCDYSAHRYGKQISEVRAQGLVSKDDLPDDLVRKVSRIFYPT